MRFFRALPAVLVALALCHGAWAQSRPPTGSAGAQPGTHIPWVSGRWYTHVRPGTAVAAIAAAANSVSCYPIRIEQTKPASNFVAKALGARVITGASGNATMAIVNASPTTGLPGTLIDYISPVSTASSATDITGSLHNGTDVLPPGPYWACYVQDNGTSTVPGFGIGQIHMAGDLGGAAPGSAVNTTGNTVGVTCTASGTACGGSGSGWSAFSGGAFTWAPDLSTATWTYAVTAIVPTIALQAN